MMTTNLFVIANVKQLRTDGSFTILLTFSRTSWCVGVLNSAIFNSFHNRVEFGTILEGLRNFGGGGGLNPQPPLGTPLIVCVHSGSSVWHFLQICPALNHLKSSGGDKDKVKATKVQRASRSIALLFP